MIRAGVLVLSDRVSAGSAKDSSGLLIKKRLEEEGIKVEDYTLLSDDLKGIADKLMHYADAMRLDLVLTTGGTGLGPRDHAPEALVSVMDREAPGIAEAVRSHGLRITPSAMLSRARAGLRKNTLIVNLPGSAKAVAESLDALFPGILHAFPMIRGEGHEESRKP
ncbi:MAG: MogA/MoaB family molybdenum cofactor biosynthesis protein [Planctomycetota bacterium]